MTTSLFCPLCCIFNARSTLLNLTSLESSEFSYKSESFFYQGNVTQKRGEIVDLGNRLDGNTSAVTNAQNVEISASEIAQTTDMKGHERLGSGSSIHLSFVFRLHSNN